MSFVWAPQGHSTGSWVAAAAARQNLHQFLSRKTAKIQLSNDSNSFLLAKAVRTINRTCCEWVSMNANAYTCTYTHAHGRVTNAKIIPCHTHNIPSIETDFARSCLGHGLQFTIKNASEKKCIIGYASYIKRDSIHGISTPSLACSQKPQFFPLSPWLCPSVAQIL